MFQAKQSNNPLSFIAQSCQVKGNLTFSGDILIAGTIEGNLSTSGNVVIEAGGVVKGNIEAKDVTISGNMHGEAHCHKLSIADKGCFEGDIFSEKLEIVESGQFIGQRHLASAKSASKAAVTTSNTKEKTNKEKPNELAEEQPLTEKQ
ncbi:polymer-forming cytoskeletal protein [Shewanella maritima]|uniref:bactofilin family protein n=1 Tax=Shewanella maritima TaxID=2520507 RepID=UPI00373602F0